MALWARAGLREADVLPGDGTSWDPWGVHVPHGRPRRARKPLLAALLSCLLPGAGQLYLGRRRRGWAMIAVTVGCLAMAVGVLSEPTALSRMVVQPGALLALLVADIGLLVFRAVAVVDAYLLASRGRARASSRQLRRSAAAGLAGILALTAAPHAAAAFYDLQAYDLITTVFAGSDPGWKASGRGGGGNNLVTAIPGRLTVLLLGGDAGPDRQGLRTDSMIVASIELKSGKAVLFGLPRNLVQAPLPPGPAADFFGGTGFPRPLNELYTFAELERRDLFPEGRRPGVLALAGVAESMLGLPIDHYALVDLKGFVDIVDALGGVTVEVTKPIRVEVDRLGTEGPQPAWVVPVGRRKMGGFMALAYVRSRKTTSDYDRMQRQRCLLGSLARQTDPAEVVRAFPKLVNVIKRSVATDIPASRLPVLLEAVGGRRASVSTVGFTPPTYAVGYSGGYPIPDVPRIQQTVQRLLRLPGATPAKRGAGTGGGSPARATTTTTVKAGAPAQESCAVTG
jgi:polyisoprenyl-teichoic acid--peptidoglycan teichoic acid transferase